MKGSFSLPFIFYLRFWVTRATVVAPLLVVLADIESWDIIVTYQSYNSRGSGKSWVLDSRGTHPKGEPI